MRNCSITVCAVLLMALTLVCSPASAEKTPIITAVDAVPVQPLDLLPHSMMGGGPSCSIGNLNAPAFAINNFVIPPENYAFVFDPGATCTVCTEGVEIKTIHVYLQTSESCNVNMRVRLREAVYPTSPSCPEPGPILNASVVYAVNMPSAGLWDIPLPITTICQPLNGVLLLDFRILSSSCATGSVPALITDNAPTLCTNYNDFGSGWTDLLAAIPSWPGNLLISADATCCSSTVPTENATWGGIKGIYQGE